MRPTLIPMFWLLGALPLAAQIDDAQSCQSAIASDPALAREQAAAWRLRGGGTDAALCEAFALDALGASTAAAERLTRIGQDPGSGLAAAPRAEVLHRAGQLWAGLGQGQLAEVTLQAALGLRPTPGIAQDLLEVALARGDGALAVAAAESAGPLPPLTQARLQIATGAPAGALDTLAPLDAGDDAVALVRAQAHGALGQRDLALAALAGIAPSSARAEEARDLARALMLSPAVPPPHADAPRPMPRRP